MKNNQETASAPRELVTELQTLITEAEAMLAGSPADSSSEMFTELRARFEAAQARVAAVYGEAKKKVVAGAKCADASIRENPYPAVAIALGAGVLVGVLLGRRTR
jgi:ElaB/YqjD/DUF883 family membrane-anchored ribosome-binding protein